MFKIVNKIKGLIGEWTEWTSSGQTDYFRNQESGQNGQMPKGMSTVLSGHFWVKLRFMELMKKTAGSVKGLIGDFKK